MLDFWYTDDHRIVRFRSDLVRRRRLLVLSCSAVKRNTSNKLPAVDLYDGPAYRVLRTFLRTHLWPKDLSIAILSAEHGLMGGLTPIATYDRRMTRDRAKELAGDVQQTLTGWKAEHGRVQLVLGEDYLGAIQSAATSLWKGKVENAAGPIGLKLQYLHNTLRDHAKKAPATREDAPRAKGRPAYFLPDWDDFVDADFDFVGDQFSSTVRSERNELHCSELVKPNRLADGILVSLAQSFGTKGLLRSLQATSLDSLAPRCVKQHFGLSHDQWAFGDCGAFSYVNEDQPTISIEQAVATYELYGFDLGASIDHIPVPEVIRNGKRRKLTKAERVARVDLTRDNAEQFLKSWRARECRFHPVGVVQALSPADYAKTAAEYVDMGYRRIAIGGLVPKSDSEILDIVKAVTKQLSDLNQRPWVHLMGVFRPKLQPAFRQLGIDSFDSATYFRKAWLRSDQNYLGSDGEWYAAIRVPPSHDPRTAKRMKAAGVDDSIIKRLETAALNALHRYAQSQITLDDCLEHVGKYDRLLYRDETSDKCLLDSYRRTLLARPWEQCDCSLCRTVGVDVLIFRGLNRNKRRGAHNTLMLFRSLSGHAP